MKRMGVKEVMSSPVVSVTPEASVPQAVRLMQQHGISGLPVVDAAGALVGMVTEADILLKECGAGGLAELMYLGRPFGPGADAEIDRRRGSRVGELMVREVVKATEDASARDVARLMTRHGINRVPIVRDGRLVGIVTRADVIRMFVRPPPDVLEDVRRVIREDLLLDPSGLEIVIRDGGVSICGSVDDPRDIHLIGTFVGEIDGVAAVDTSGLAASRAVRT